ncbi:AarF/ABC1/UbiB kinase family protein [Aestuariicoccus sp. MJ-SS9]|uniref:ABC1 kinase family protein n=1 Tax=Aestuariicoccus sp. MJ-SS9 TaxID=3079855 RepID=UPI0029149CB8|nr:AarF/ABC1/UbiB kinase family protein [Aestuariicoccus sp. MJ-SS9]MDU8911573.1 AarF/ABC1/UbiB kinase family protein [Aestuariicoccus sp. MJ-SS9]
MSKPYEPRGLAVPSGRLGRAARLGGLTSGILGAMAVEGTRRLAGGQRPAARDLLLTPGNARRITEKLATMRGAAMKMGQLISMEAGDLLPPELAQILAPLRAQAHFMPPAQLKRVLTANYGADFLKRFARFDVRPIAAASIGQVHRATAHDGRDLALKIQYPGVRAAIDADVRNVDTLLRMSGLLPRGLDLAPLLEEARKQLHDEADYAREARYLARFGDLLKHDAAFRVPRHHADFSTSDILAMSFEPSHDIDDLAQADQDTRDRAMTDLTRLFLKELFDWRMVQTDPNFANYRVDPESGRIVLLDFGAARSFDEPLTERFRALLRAGLAREREAIRAAMIAIGYFRDTTPSRQQEAILRMADMALPMIASHASFDFGDTALIARLRDEGMRLGVEEEFREIPPIDALFLQRKMAGLFLLATRLRARVPVRALIEPYVERR